MDLSLALGGGGAKGNAHIGVLRRLEKEGFRIRAVAGASFGGLVAVLYAAGYPPDEIEDLFVRADQSRLYGRSRADGPSLLGLAGARKWLDAVLGERTFDDLLLPCAVSAVDLETAREVTLAEGYLRDGILATVALPGVFPAQRWGDWELVDGGVLDPVPVSVARALAPSLPVAAVVLSTPIGEPSRAMSMPVPGGLPKPILDRLRHLRYAQAFDIFLRSVEIGGRAVTEYRLEVDKPDVIIRPQVGHIALLARVDVRAVARLGEQAVEVALPELKRAVGWPRRLRRLLGAD